jgi:DNA-binding winged helix-turn-helix (wHTH) protein
VEDLMPTRLLELEADEVPTIEDPDLLRRGRRWVPLSPNEAAIARLLVDRFGSVVGRERLAAAVWNQHSDTSIALNQLMVRVRRRIEPLSLEITTVWRRGYLMRDVRH